MTTRLATCAAGAAIAAIALMALGVPMPRLIGYGCANAPSIGPITYTGPRLAHEEDSFAGPCARIEPLPWITE